MRPHADGMTGETREMRERRRPPNDQYSKGTALRNQGCFLMRKFNKFSVLHSRARRFFIARKEKNMRRIIEFLEEHAETMIAGAIGGLSSAVILLTISG